MVEYVRRVLGLDRISQHRTYRALGQCRSTQRRTPYVSGDEPRTAARMIEPTCGFVYRRVTALLRAAGFAVDQ